MTCLRAWVAAAALLWAAPAVQAQSVLTVPHALGPVLVRTDRYVVHQNPAK
jgi:hypothetical protein